MCNFIIIRFAIFRELGLNKAESAINIRCIRIIASELLKINISKWKTTTFNLKNLPLNDDIYFLRYKAVAAPFVYHCVPAKIHIYMNVCVQNYFIGLTVLGTLNMVFNIF